MSEAVQSDLILVLDIKYKNVKLHNDDTVEHLDNGDKAIACRALPLRALLHSKMMTVLKILTLLTNTFLAKTFLALLQYL